MGKTFVSFLKWILFIYLCIYILLLLINNSRNIENIRLISLCIGLLALWRTQIVMIIIGLKSRYLPVRCGNVLCPPRFMENENKMQRCITDPRPYELIQKIILMWTAVIFMALGLQLYSLYACASVCLCLGLYAYASVFLTVCLCFLSFKAR